MREWIIAAIGQYGYLGVFLLIAVENIFPPIPSEVILTFAGFSTTYTSLTYFGTVAFATLGSVFGAIVLYAVGRALSPERLLALCNGRVGRVLHFDAADIEKARASFAQKGYSSVLLCRCVPILRSLISIPAGMAKMRFLPFLGLTALGSTVWNMLLIGLGRFAGDNWESVNAAFSAASDGMKMLMLAACLVLLVLLWRKQKKPIEQAKSASGNT